MKSPSNLLLAATALGAVATGKAKEHERKHVTPDSLNAARDLLAESDLELQAREAAKHETRTVTDEFEPILIEGHLEGCVIDVLMPNGETWRFAKPDTCAAPCPVLVCIHSEKTAYIHRPSAEGLHPFLGMARRFGVDAPKKGGADV